MHPETKIELVNHMKDFGLHMIAKGLVNATFNEMLNPYGHAMSIVHVAHGAEIIIKARIAQEHPLLIFNKLPKAGSSRLELVDLLNNGQTIQYSELLERLWSATGYRIVEPNLFERVGRIRNQIIHLAIPEEDLSALALSFGFKLIEPAINEWWDTTLLEYACSYDMEYLEYVFEQLDRLGIEVAYRLSDENQLVLK